MNPSPEILNASILIVDDQLTNVTLLAEMLREAGYLSVTSTTNPLEVCALYAKNHYTLILLDLQMPEMDGFQVMEGLQAIEPGGYLPVLVITAQPSHKLRALKAGARDFVSKPFEMGEVLARVHNMVEVRLLHQETKTLYALVVAEQKATAQMLHLFRSGPVAMGINTVAGQTILDVNDQYCRFFGYEREEMIGQNVVDLRLWADPEERPAVMARLQEERVIRGFEIKKRLRSGEERSVLASLELIEIANESEPVLISMFLDITERKLSAAALQESESWYHSLFENMLEGYAYCATVFENDQLVDFTFLEVNGSFETLTGLKNVVGKNISGVVPGMRDSSRGLFDFYGQAILNGRRERCETFLPSLNVWLSVSVYSRDPGHFVAVFDNITKRKQSEEELLTSLGEFRTLAEALPQIVWIARPDGANVFFNQHWADYTGRTMTESNGDGWTAAFHPDDRDRIWQAWQLAWSTVGVFSIESRLRRADGVYRWWLVRGVPVKGTGGEVLRWVGTCTDVDDLKQAHERMTQQAALLDIAHDAILVKDLADQIILWNKGAERTYGWISNEAVGRKAVELLGHDPVPFEEARLALLADGEWQGEMVVRAKDGHEIISDVRWTLMKDGKGEPKSILALHRDITAKKKLEGQFLRMQRMESIGTLASGIAHDLNNVLAPIMMSVEMLTSMAASEEEQSLLSTLQSCAQRGADLVKQVLSFARGVEGRQVPVNLMHVLRDIENIIRDTFPKNISFKLNSPHAVWTVIGDPTQLHQVFMNLCVNARDAMPLGGRLSVTAENVNLDEIYADMNPEAKPGSYLLVKVEDTGQGVPPAIKNKIFEPFFTTKEIGKGTGLGLSTTLAIVKSHGGFVSLYSEGGLGAQFNVYLPTDCKLATSDQNPTTRQELPSGRGELILVVDDEENIRTITQKTLERFNYRVLVAKNGAEAVGLYAKNGAEIALVLTDMAMPILDGPALIVALRAMTPDVKIIGCSGNASSNGRARALGAGILHFIPKPYTAETLLRLLPELLRDENKN